MLLLGLVAFALLQLWYLHKALKLADPTIVCPLAFCFYNLSSIVNGLVYFDQFALLPTLHLVFVIFGIVVLLSGVWVVSFQSIDVQPWTGTETESIEDVEVMVDDAITPSSGDQLAAPAVLAQEIIAEPSTIQHRRTTTSTLSVCTSDSLSNSVLLSPQLSQGEIANSSHGGRRIRKRQTLSPELISAPPAPGFSIGLSPASPGFSLVNRGRMRVSSISNGTGASVRWPDTIRRAISEDYSRLPMDVEGVGNRDAPGEELEVRTTLLPGSRKTGGLRRWFQNITGS